MLEELGAEPCVDEQVDEGRDAVQKGVADFQPDSKSDQHLEGQSARCQGTDYRKSETDKQTDRSQELENTSQLSVIGKFKALELTHHVRSCQATYSVTNKRERTEKIENVKHQVAKGSTSNPNSDPPLVGFRMGYQSLLRLYPEL